MSELGPAHGRSSSYNQESPSSQTVVDETKYTVPVELDLTSEMPGQTHDVYQFPDPDLAQSESNLFDNDEIIEEEQLEKLRVWFGDLSRLGFDRRYLLLRDELSDAAYGGRFWKLFEVLADVEQAYGQSWANAPRLSK
jgi:hypothetical protein